MKAQPYTLFSLKASVSSLMLAFALLSVAFPAAAQGDSISVSAAEFQRMVYSAHLHTQLSEKPELDAGLQVLLELQRRNPNADPVALAGVLTNALQRYRGSAPYYIRTNGFRDEILAAYLDALRQVPGRTNFVPANLTLLNNFMLGPADYNSNVAPATLMCSLVDSGNQRLFRSEGQALKRQALVDDCVVRAHSDAAFASAMDRLLRLETPVSLGDSPADIIGSTNSPLHDSPTMKELLALSAASGNGSVTVFSNQLMNLFSAEMQTIWDTIHTNLALRAEINQSQPDLLAYLTNQAAIDANVQLLAAVQQGQRARLASATAAVLAQSKFLPGDDQSRKAVRVASAGSSMGLGVAMLCAGNPGGLQPLLTGGFDVFSMFTGTETAQEALARELGNVKALIEDLNYNMNYRFDRVDRSLTTIFDTLNTNFRKIEISHDLQGRQIAQLNGNVNDIRKSLVDVQAALNRLEQDILLGFETAERNTHLILPANAALFFEIQNPGEIMTYEQYSSLPNYENEFFTYAANYAMDNTFSPYQFLDLTTSHLEGQLAARPLSANLNYIQQFLSTNLANGQQLTAGTTPLANPQEWFMGAYAYLQVAAENPMLFRRKAPRVGPIITSGENLTDFLRSLIFTGTNINWSLYTALEHYYITNLTSFNAQVSATEGQYATETNFALNTWRQWDIAAPRVTTAATELLPATPRNLLAAGQSHSLALKPDGAVGGWGDNSYGQTAIPRSANNVVALAAGRAHNLALKADGTVVAWGYNDYCQTNVPSAATNVVAIAAGFTHSLALKADGTLVGWGNSPQLTNIPPAATNVVAIAGGFDHNLALKADGTIIGWGSDSAGQTDIPPSATNVVVIAAAFMHSLAIRADGTVVGWGDNSSGQTDVPVGLTNVAAIAGGDYFSLALRADGTVVAWGDNSYGQTNTPVGLSNVVAIAAGAAHCLALKADGTVVGWGDNTYGQSIPLGWLASPRVRTHVAAGLYHSLALEADGTVVGWGAGGPGSTWPYNYGQTTIPSGLMNVAAIAAGYFHSLALKADGTVVGWGAGGPGTSGNNHYGQSTIPPRATNVVAIAAAHFHSLALKADGTVIGWGAGGPGTSSAPNFGQTTIPNSATNLVAIAAGGSHSLALKADGTVIGWGAGGPGTSGGQNFGQTTIPSSATNLVAIAAGGTHSLALKADSTVVAWGDNLNNKATVPPGLSNVVAIAAGGEYSLALKADGTLVFWGYSPSPVPGGLRNVVAIAGGDSHSLALKADGTVVAIGSGAYTQTSVPPHVIDLAAWGENAFGLGNVAPVSSPIIAVTAGSAHCEALTAGGSVVAWGLNTWGQTDVPPQAGNGVQAVASGLGHSLALLTNGAVLAWGLNDFGQANVPPSAQSNVVAISAGGKHNLALKTDGTVLAWGLNGSGQINVPPDVQTKVVAISAGGEHSLALTAGGAVWAWGGNSSGQTNVRPEALSGVVAIAAGRYHNLALKSGGGVVAWGLNSSGQCVVPPAAQSGVVAIGAGITHSLALKADGTVVVWGVGPAGFAPTQTRNNVVAIAVGDRHSLVLRAATPSDPGSVQTLSLVRVQIPLRVVSLLRGGNDYVVAELGRAGALRSAAGELSGAKALLAAVLELGMPHTLERDEILHGFLYGNESLVDTSVAGSFLQTQNAQFQATPNAPPQTLAEAAVLRYLRFADRLSQCLTNLQATGQPEIPRLVGHTLRLLYLLRDAWTQPANSPPPAVELWTENNYPRLLIYGEPYAHYTLQFSGSLGAPAWSTVNLPGLQLHTNAHNQEVVAPPVSGSPQRFYRAMLPLP